MKQKLLIVGDDPTLFEAFRKLLKTERYQVITSSHPNEIFHLISTMHPGLLIMNLKLYGDFGTELLVQVKKIFPPLAVLVMTTFTNVLTERFILQLGANDYISMPFDIRDMLTKIRQNLCPENVSLS